MTANTTDVHKEKRTRPGPFLRSQRVAEAPPLYGLSPRSEGEAFAEKLMKRFREEVRQIIRRAREQEVSQQEGKTTPGA